MLPFDDKALPDMPGNEYGRDPSPVDEAEEVPVIETATVTRIIRDDGYSPQLPPPVPIKDRKGSEPALQLDSKFSAGSLTEHYSLQSSFSKSPAKERNFNQLVIQHPLDPQYMPAPLSPRR